MQCQFTVLHQKFSIFSIILLLSAAAQLVLSYGENQGGVYPETIRLGPGVHSYLFEGLTRTKIRTSIIRVRPGPGTETDSNKDQDQRGSRLVVWEMTVP